MNLPTIIVDSREQKDCFTFDGLPYRIKKLDTGDYSLEGYEKKITIDRKRNSGEIYMNLGSDYTRFEAELVRMSKMEEAYIVCSFPYEHINTFPQYSTIPNYRWKRLKMNNKFLRKRIATIQENYKIEFIFCDTVIEASHATLEILQKFYEKKLSRKQK